MKADKEGPFTVSDVYSTIEEFAEHAASFAYEGKAHDALLTHETLMRGSKSARQKARSRSEELQNKIKRLAVDCIKVDEELQSARLTRAENVSYESFEGFAAVEAKKVDADFALILAENERHQLYLTLESEVRVSEMALKARETARDILKSYEPLMTLLREGVAENLTGERIKLEMKLEEEKKELLELTRMEQQRSSAEKKRLDGVEAEASDRATRHKETIRRVKDNLDVLVEDAIINEDLELFTSGVDNILDTINGVEKEIKDSKEKAEADLKDATPPPQFSASSFKTDVLDSEANLHEAKRQLQEEADAAMTMLNRECLDEDSLIEKVEEAIGRVLEAEEAYNTQEVDYLIRYVPYLEAKRNQKVVERMYDIETERYEKQVGVREK